MDALRRQQINEILNYDRDMNLRALASHRKQVALMGPQDGEMSELLNQEVIDAANESVTSLLVLMDRRRADLNKMPLLSVERLIQAIFHWLQVL
jgi:hypothetical protein